MLAGAVAGFVDVTLESVDVVFDFYNKNSVRLTVKTDDETPEIENLNYRIDRVNFILWALRREILTFRSMATGCLKERILFTSTKMEAELKMYT
jgi:hypothetical protein